MGDPDGYECVKVALPRRPHIGVHGLCARVPIDARTVVLCVAHARCDQLLANTPSIAARPKHNLWMNSPLWISHRSTTADLQDSVLDETGSSSPK